MTNLSFKPVIFSILYLHCIVMLFAVPSQSLKYSKIKADVSGYPIELFLGHWSSNTHLIVFGICVLASVLTYKIKEDTFGFISGLALAINMGLTVYWIVYLFKL